MKKKLLIIMPILIAIIAFVFVYRYYNKEDKNTSLTVVEKKWVEENKKQVIDFEIINDYPLYGMNGNGVFFDFVNDFEKNVGLEFNKIPYLKESTSTTDSYRIRILNNNDEVSNDDLVIFQDSYIAVGRSYRRINHISDMKNLTFGVFSNDSSDISYYLKSGTNLSFKNYDTIDELYKALDSSEVDMIIVPNIMYLDRTIGKSEYSINYYFTEINKKVVLTLSKNNNELNKIKHNKFISVVNSFIPIKKDIFFDLKREVCDSNVKINLDKCITLCYCDFLPNKEIVDVVIKLLKLYGISVLTVKYDSLSEYLKYRNNYDMHLGISSPRFNSYYFFIFDLFNNLEKSKQDYVKKIFLNNLNDVKKFSTAFSHTKNFLPICRLKFIYYNNTILNINEFGDFYAY